MALPYTLTEQQQRIIRMADMLAARFAERATAHDRDGSFPRENYADLHEAGYLRLVLPRDYGGAGATVLDMVLAQEHLAQGDGSTALAAGMLVSLLGRMREEHGWPAPIFAAICETIADEGGLINSVMTEPELGSVSRGGIPATAATPTAGGWLISGHKIFVTGAPALRYLATGVVLPPSDDAPQGYSATAIVEASAPGLRLEDTWSDNLSMRTSGNYDVYFEDVFVPDDWMVARTPIGGTAKAGKRPPTNAWGLPITAVYLGIGQAACNAACDYANTRVPPSLGTPIAELPHIQQWIGQMQVTLDAARAVLYDAAQAWDNSPDQHDSLAAPLAAAKYLCTNAACAATDTALRVAGGFSLTRNLPLERYFRDARAGLFQPPQDDMALALIGRTALTKRGQ